MDTSTSRADFTWKGPYKKRVIPVPPQHRDPILSDGAPTQMARRKRNDYILMVDRRYINPKKYQDDSDPLYPGHVEYMPSKCRVTVYQNEICKMEEARKTTKRVVFPREWSCRRESEYGYQYYCPELRAALFADPRLPPYKPERSELELSDKMKKILTVTTGESMYSAVHSALGCELMTKVYCRC